MEKQSIFQSKLLPYALVAPQLAIVLIFFYWPAAQAVIQSFLLQDAFGLSTSFVWFDNYVELFKEPAYFEIHRVGQFTMRSLDIDVVLDLMIHDLDIVQWLVGEDVAVTEVHAVGIPILTNRVDAANARIEFATGAVANITASRVGTEKIRKMRFFQPRDYVVVDYLTNYASISNLAPSAHSPWPGVQTKVMEVRDLEPLRGEIESFMDVVTNKAQPIVSGADGRRALDLALRTLQQIEAHTVKIGSGGS